MSNTLKSETLESQARDLQEIFSLRSAELLSRIVILTIGAVLLSVFMGKPYLLWWFLIYMIPISAAVLLARQLRKGVSRGLVRAVFLCEAISLIIFIAFPIFAFFQDDLFIKFLGITAFVARIMNSFTARSRIRFLSMLDWLCHATVIAIIGVYVSLNQGSGPAQWIGPILVVGAFIYYWLTWTEIAQMRQRNEAMMARQARAERMEAVAKVTGGVAHDFNNILTVIVGNLDLYHEVTTPHEKNQLVRSTQRAADRASHLVSQLMSFSRQSPLIARSLTLIMCLEIALDATSDDRGDDVDIVIDIPDNLRMISADQLQFENAMINIILNAQEAMPERGILTITARNCTRAPDDLSPDWRYVEIEISDTGAGIDPGILPQVFDPFFTTKPIGKGSGLGLSMARGFAQQSGGTLTIDSQKGHGTQVKMILRSDAPASPRGDAPAIPRDDQTSADS